MQICKSKEKGSIVRVYVRSYLESEATRGTPFPQLKQKQHQ